MSDSRKYDDEQYKYSPDTQYGFTCYERLMVELNNRQYYDEETYCRFLNENGLDPHETYDKNTDHAQLLETVYAILHTLLSNIDAYRKIETEFTTVSEASTALSKRLASLKKEIEEVKAAMNYSDTDFSFMYYTRG